jgi:hypothetical protein
MYNGNFLRPCMNIKFYSLLHLASEESSAMNVKVKNFERQVLLYLENAVSFSQSLRRLDTELILLTNRRDMIMRILDEHGYSLDVRTIPFITEVPTGIRFYSAHFKFDAIRYLATQNEDDYVALCDSDMVCVNDVNPAFQNNISNGIPMYYDISDHTMRGGAGKNITDLKLLLGFDNDGRWAGGEFLAGRPDFFKHIVAELDLIYPKYIQNITQFGHIGDEMVMSAILEKMRRQGENIANAGTIGIVGRYWSGDVLHAQHDINYFRGMVLLHLPADKFFLASLAHKTKFEHNIFFLYDGYRRSPSFIAKKIMRYFRRVLNKCKKIIVK